MINQISIWWRGRKRDKEARKMLHTFHEWKSVIDSMKYEPTIQRDAVMVCKLDDIGDYILIRNLWTYYRQYAQGRPMIMLGNQAWKSIYETWDAATFDVVIWVDKGKYFNDASYRENIWKEVRDHQVGTFIAPALTRSLLLDDMMCVAANAKINIGTNNTHEVKEVNAQSDSLYNHIWDNQLYQFEFLTNKRFIETLLDKPIEIQRTAMNKVSTDVPLDKPYVVLFIGANIKSRRWTAAGWIDTILQLKAAYPRYTWVLLGGPADIPLAKEIVTALPDIPVLNEVGKHNLVKSIGILQEATLLITNNTMAYHVTMASDVPTVIITSGDKYYRFTNIDQSLYPNTFVIYPARFNQLKSSGNTQAMRNFVAVKRDIASIKADSVIQLIQSNKLLA